MVMPATKPLDGDFWYILDDQKGIEWRPRPKLRGEFYLGWLGQNREVVGAGLVCLKQGQITHICTHGTPYYWFQPYEVLPSTVEVMREHQVQGVDEMTCDYTLAGWGMRDQTPPATVSWSDALIPPDTLQPLLPKAARVIVRDFRSNGEPPPPYESGGLLARTKPATPPDPLQALLNQLRTDLGEANVGPVLVELIKHDVNVMPGYRTSGLFENLSAEEQLPAPSKIARLVISAIYQLAPVLGSRRLSHTLLLNSLRQRHPFDVTWGADFLVKCLGMPNLIRLLQAAVAKEKDDQIRGNILDLLQELGYGTSVGLEDEVLNSLTSLRNQPDLGALGQVVDSHLLFLQEYRRQRDAASRPAG